jgi:hypothetical protein
MAKNKVSEWSSTPASNTDVGGIDINEGCAPSGINNAIREVMAQIKDMQAGTDSDNFSVGGNLSVTGTSTLTGAVTAPAGVTGNVTGNITGNVTGNVTGSLTGNVTGNVSGTALNVTGVVAVANGGTGLATLTANNVMLGNGTSTPSFVAPSTSGNVLTSNGTTFQSTAPVASGVGVGQTWQNVLGSRARNTNYTNSTGKPIMVNVWINDFGGDAKLVCDSVNISFINGVAGQGATLSGIIPNGSVYQVDTSESIDGWAELR